MFKNKKDIKFFLKSKFIIEDRGMKEFKILKSIKEINFKDVYCENDQDKDCLDERGEDLICKEIGIYNDSILDFEYRSIGPMSFTHSLSRMDCGGDYFYIEQHIDQEEPIFIAAIHKTKYDKLLKLFLKEYYKSNGTSYSDHEMFSSLPSITHILDRNINSDLLKECFKLFLDHISKKYEWHGSWHDERESMLKILENPGDFERSMQLLDELKDIKSKDSSSIKKYLLKKNNEKQEGLLEINDEEKNDILKLLIFYKVNFS